MKRTFSAREIADFAMCPQRFLLTALEGHKPPKKLTSIASRFALEVLNALKAGDCTDIEKYLNRKFASLSPGDFADEKISQDAINSTATKLSKLMDMFWKSHYALIPSSKKIIVGFDPWVELSFDAVDVNHSNVHSLIVSNRKWSKDEEKKRAIPLILAWAVQSMEDRPLNSMEDHPLIPFRLPLKYHYNIFILRKNDEEIIPHTLELTKHHAEQGRQIMSELGNSLSTGHFPSRPSVFGCANCPGLENGRCPLYKDS